MIDSNREEFEKLSELAANLHNVVFDKGSNEYLPKKMGYVIHEFSAYFLNGAWYAFQEQQMKLDCCREENKTHLEKIDGVIKYIEPSDELNHKAYRDLIKILKGNKDETGLN